MGNQHTKESPSKKNSIQRSFEKSLDKNSKKKLLFKYNGETNLFYSDEEELFSDQILKFKKRNGKEVWIFHLFQMEKKYLQI